MTTNEFIDSLSPKAYKILNNLVNNENNTKQIKITFTDSIPRAHFINSDTYIIELNNNTPLPDMEYQLLHELFHIIQEIERFPNVKQTQPIYQTLSSYVSSIVLDCDVYERLLKIGYVENPLVEMTNYQIIKSFLITEKTDLLFNNLDHLEKTFIFSAKLICLELFSNIMSQKDLNWFVCTTRTNFPFLYKNYTKIKNAITKCGYSSPKNAFKTFKTIIRELNLQDYVTIIS